MTVDPHTTQLPPAVDESNLAPRRLWHRPEIVISSIAQVTGNVALPAPVDTVTFHS